MVPFHPCSVVLRSHLSRSSAKTDCAFSPPRRLAVKIDTTSIVVQCTVHRMDTRRTSPDTKSCSLVPLNQPACGATDGANAPIEPIEPIGPTIQFSQRRVMRAPGMRRTHRWTRRTRRLRPPRLPRPLCPPPSPFQATGATRVNEANGANGASALAFSAPSSCRRTTDVLRTRASRRLASRVSLRAHA